MSDFFEGLAARSSGAAAALRPRVASAYEARDTTNVVEEVTTAATPAAMPRDVQAAAATASLGAQPEAAERVVVRDVVLTPADGAATTPRMVSHDRQPGGEAEPGRHQHAHAQTHDGTHDTQDDTHTQPREPSTIAGRATERSTVLTSAVERTTIVTERDGRPPADITATPAEPRPSLLSTGESGDTSIARPPAPPRRPRTHLAPHAQPQEQPSRPASEPLQRQATPEPTIRITIGRVEVRAVQPAQPAPRPAPRPVAAGPTLQEFLAERERRK